MQVIVLKNEDLTPTVMREILEFRSQIFEEVYQLASDRPESYSPEKPDRNHSKVYGQYMLSKLENPSKFDRRRLQFFGRLMAQKLAA